MSMYKQNKGFTLIELLVVIAIIGILASVVLASLNSARAKGVDAGVKGDLSAVRQQASLFYDNNGGNYGANVTTSSCTTGLFADTTIGNAVADAATKSGTTGQICLSDSSTGGANADSWAVSVPLKTDPLQAWCVDSTGNAKVGVATDTSNAVSCI